MVTRSSLVVAAAAVAASALSSFGQVTGPNASHTPYVIPTAPGVQTISIISNGNGTGGLPDVTYSQIDASGNVIPASTYRMAGIPDGAGAYDNGDGTFTFLMNHELGGSSGVSRAHGSAGAFVSQWKINKADLSVVGGRDLITSVAPITGGLAPFNRFCSADLPAVTAFYNAGSGLGTQERIFMNGEEAGNEGRAFGTVVSTGTAYYLPDLGKFSWENSVANPFAQNKTIVVGTDDQTPGQLYFYVGDKKSTGNDIDKAGLTGGKLYGLKSPVALETNAAPGIGNADLVDLTAHATGTGVNLQTQSVSAGVTEYARPEDAVWNPANPKELYWVNTGAGTTPNRLYRMTFDDITQPELGGTVDMLLDGTEGTVSADNMTLVNGTDGKTRVLIQEDPGSSNRLAKIWMYTVEDDSLLEVAAHDGVYFDGSDIDPVTPGTQLPSTHLTTNEESSGIIPVWDILGPGWFLADVQAHYSIGGELVEGGQAFAIFIPQSIPEPTSLGFLAVAGLGALRRRR